MSTENRISEVIVVPTKNKSIYWVKEERINMGCYVMGMDRIHIYFLCDEYPKKDDWVYDLISKTVYKVTDRYLISYSNSHYPGSWKKIIASTDELSDGTGLGIRLLPRPTNKFLDKFLSQYNLGNIITKVLVEYEKYWEEEWHGSNEDGEPKAVDRFKLNIALDNTITIYKVIDLWDEIMKILSNPDVSWGTKEAFVREKYNSPTLKIK